MGMLQVKIVHLIIGHRQVKPENLQYCAKADLFQYLSNISYRLVAWKVRYLYMKRYV